MTRKDFLSKMALSVAAVAVAPQVATNGPVVGFDVGYANECQSVARMLVQKTSLFGRYTGIDVPVSLKMQFKPSHEEILNETGPVPDGYHIGARSMLWVDHGDGTGHWFSQYQAIPDGTKIEDFKDGASIYVLA